MTLPRKVCLAFAATVLGAALGGVASPAVAGDSGWGCGGQCATDDGDAPSAEAVVAADDEAVDAVDAADEDSAAADTSDEARPHRGKHRRHAGSVSALRADSGWGCGGQC